MGQSETHVAKAKKEHATATSANAEEQKLQNILDFYQHQARNNCDAAHNRCD